MHHSKGQNMFFVVQNLILIYLRHEPCVLVQFDISPVHTWGFIVEKLNLPVQGLMLVCQDNNIYSCLMQTNKLRYHSHSIAYSN